MHITKNPIEMTPQEAIRQGKISDAKEEQLRNYCSWLRLQPGRQVTRKSCFDSLSGNQGKKSGIELLYKHVLNQIPLTAAISQIPEVSWCDWKQVVIFSTGWIYLHGFQCLFFFQKPKRTNNKHQRILSQNPTENIIPVTHRLLAVLVFLLCLFLGATRLPETLATAGYCWGWLIKCYYNNARRLGVRFQIR